MTRNREFAILYRWEVEPAHQAEFIRRWRLATEMLRDQHGALGSCLTRDRDGRFVAFARWPSEESRAAAFAARQPAEPLPGIVHFEEERLDVEADLLVGSGRGDR